MVCCNRPSVTVHQTPALVRTLTTASYHCALSLCIPRFDGAMGLFLTSGKEGSRPWNLHPGHSRDPSGLLQLDLKHQLPTQLFWVFLL